MAEFELSTMRLRDVYGLTTRVIGPRPIAWVSTLDAEGRGNLAPFSYFMMGGSNPPSCVICPVRDRHGEQKDTIRNLMQTGEYVINIATFDLAEQVNQSSFAYAPGIDELDVTGLTRAPSKVVRPPRVAESPVHLECKVFRVVPHGDGKLASEYVIGEILWIHVDDAVMTDGHPDPAKLHLIGRLGGSDYTHVSAESLFSIDRPKTG